MLDVRDNLLHGTIPDELYTCVELEWIDLSRNSFSSTISTEIGNLRNLKVIKLNENFLSGSIPSRIFMATELQTLMLQANKLTGSIPTEIGTLDFIEFAHLSYNSIKGNVPTQMSNLVNLKSILLHANQLTGTAPEMKNKQDDFQFITDCGSPSFLLQAPLECKSCTKCCNSLGLCQIKPKRDFRLDVTGYLVVILAPIAMAFLFHLMFSAMKRGNFCSYNHEVNSTSILNNDSTYCLIFSDSKLAWAIYMATTGAQISLFNLFLRDLNFESEHFTWQFIFKCPENSSICEKGGNRDISGWILFYIVVLSYLGKDFVIALHQLAKSTDLRDLRLGFSGLVVFFLTGLALVTSVIFNMALAKTNQELIMNAVILLFINDIDEQLLALVESFQPIWLKKRFEEIERNMNERQNKSSHGSSDSHGSINLEEEDLS